MLKRITILTLAGVVLMTISATGKSYVFEFQKNVAVTEKSNLKVTNISGSVEIVGGSNKEISISAVKNIRAADEKEAEKIAEQIEIRVTNANNRVIVETNYLRPSEESRSFWEELFGGEGGSHGSVDYTITVPSDCRTGVDNVSGDIAVSDVNDNVSINGTSGAVVIRDVKGAVDIETVSGDIEIDDVSGDVNISATSSDLELNSITGAVDLRSVSGDTRGFGLAGSISISQTSGDVRLKELEGDLRVKSTSGDIGIDQKSGAVDVQTHSGDVVIRTELASGKDYFVETTSGEISFSVPENASGSVQLETNSGSIDSRLMMNVRTHSERRLVGNFGKDGPNISLTTSSGDIILGPY